MEIINELLSRKQIKIYQKPEMFNFTLDSILLANFCTITKKTKRIIDFCTGNAPIPMYLTLRTDSLIDAIEIQSEVFELGKKSIESNGFENQINILLDNVKDIHKKLNKKYDLVTVNPPFFKVNKESNLNKSDYKTIARHEVMINLEEIIIEAKRLLNNGGYLSMIQRPNRLADIIFYMRKHKIEPRRMRYVHSFFNKEASMVLIEGRLSTKEAHLIVEKPLIIYEEVDKYTDELKKMFSKE